MGVVWEADILIEIEFLLRYSDILAALNKVILLFWFLSEQFRHNNKKVDDVS